VCGRQWDSIQGRIRGRRGDGREKICKITKEKKRKENKQNRNDN
jgi:hypothetical protein